MKASKLAGVMLVPTLMLSSLSAEAATQTFSGSFSSSPTDVTNAPVTVSQFDPTLGTLNSATFTLSANMNTSLSVANDGAFFVGWDKTVYQVSLAGDAPYNSIQVGASAPQRILGTGTVGDPFAFSNAASISGLPNPNTYNQTGPTLNPGGTFALTTGLTPFLGSGSLSFFLTTLNNDTLFIAGTQTGGSPPNSQQIATFVSANVAVTYDYSPVPVPAALPLVLAGLGVIGGLARKKKQEPFAV